MDIRKKQPARKEKFYVFSGIEKTLMGEDFIRSHYGDRARLIDYYAPNPNCISALNYLLKQLEKKFDVRLVITSKKRKEKAMCESYLKLYGLDYHKTMYFTKYIDGLRGEKIVEFLEENGANPLTFHTAPLYVRFLKNFKDNPDFSNYVVIEGGCKSISRYIPQKQIKKVSLKTGLTMEDVESILEANGIEPDIISKDK